MTTELELHTLSGAYAIDALSDDEAAAFRTHLDTCVACCEEVRELRSAAARMGASEAIVPPAHLKERVLEAADRTPQLPPKVTSIKARRPNGWMPKLLTAAAAVVLIVGAVLGIGQLQRGDDTVPLAAGVSQVFEAPDAHTAEVKTAKGVLRVATSPSKGEMAVDTRDLAPLDDDHVYQLWAIVDGTMTSAGLVEDKDAGAHMAMPAAGTQVAITVEPAGGSQEPTTDPIIQVDPSAV
jgi:anti-sigma-K factor RskA